MVFIDGTVVNVALAALQADLKATAIDVQWVVEAYALLLAALLLVGGSLGDAHGRKRVYMAGVIVFAVASAWCGFAPDVRQLIFARAVQGIGAALLVPGSLAIISSSFREQVRGQAIGTWSGFTAITTAVGPVIGGWLIEQASWRWIFFINLPLALIVSVLTLLHVPESRNPKTAGGDWWGAVLATVGLGGVTYALIESSIQGWGHPTVMFTLFAGLSALLLFIVVEMRSRVPLLPLSLFHSRNFSGANLLTLWLYSALSGSLFFFPLNLIQVQGYSATAAGAAFLPFIVLMFLLSRWSGGLVDRYGFKLPLIVGPIIAAIGFALFAVPSIGDSYWVTFLPAVVVLGLGMAVSVAPLTTAVMNAVGEEQAGIASGVNNTVSRVAAVLAVAILGIVMLGTFNQHLSERLNGLDLTPVVTQKLDEQRIRLAAMEIPAEIDSDMKATLRQSVKQSFVAGFRLVMLIASGLALAGAVSAWLIIEDKRPYQVRDI
jgi:EmrB/QacA subfamily drug resistance transporter